jgi:hypothetical protein
MPLPLLLESCKWKSPLHNEAILFPMLPGHSGMKFEEDEPGGGGTTASKGSLGQDFNVTWQSDCDVPHRQWRFTIRQHGHL